MVEVPNAIKIVTGLLIVHFVLCLIVGIGLIATGAMISAAKPGSDVWSKIDEAFEKIGRNPTQEDVEAIGSFTTVLGVIVIAFGIAEVIAAIFLYNGKSWARFLGIAAATIEVIFSLIIWADLITIIGLIFGIPILYFLLFDKSTSKFFEKKKLTIKKSF